MRHSSDKQQQSKQIQDTPAFIEKNRDHKKKTNKRLGQGKMTRNEHRYE